MAGETVITVIGNLVDDPELRFTPSGAAVAKFRVASTPRTFDRQTNEWKDGESLFLTCSVWRQAAENVAESLQRGMRVIVQGRLKQRSYEDREGVKRTVYELDVDEVGPSLRNATAKVTKTAGGGARGGQGGYGGGVGVGVGDVQRDVVLDQRVHDPSLEVGGRDRGRPPQIERVVGDQQVGAELHRLVDDLLDGVDGEQHPGDLLAGVAHHRADRVPGLGPLGGPQVLQRGDDFRQTGHGPRLPGCSAGVYRMRPVRPGSAHPSRFPRVNRFCATRMCEAGLGACARRCGRKLASSPEVTER